MGFIVFLLFSLSSWLCSIPMWATLISHFVFGLPIIWFWLTLVLWILAGVIRYLVIMYARWGGNSPRTNDDKPNKNPYSNKDLKL